MRRVFPDNADKLAYRPGVSLGGAIGAKVTIYADANGTALADIRSYPDVSAVSGSQLTVDGNSQLPLFYGPDDQSDTLYARIEGGSIVPIYARVDDRVDNLLIEPVNVVSASGAAVTLPDVTINTLHRITLTANCAITLPTPAPGKSFTVVLVQDGTGSRTVTWNGTIKWPGGTTPTLTTTASKEDVITFLCTNVSWLGFVAGQNF